MLNSFIKDFLRAFYSPKILYQEISADRQSGSWLCVLIYCLVYVGGSLWLYFEGFTPFVEPWIKLSGDRYYLVQAFYILPLVFLMWILGTGVLHIMSNQFGGSGRFDTLFSMTGYSLWAPWYPLIIVDSIHSTPEWLYNTVLGVCIILILIGTTIAVMIEEKVNLVTAIFSSVIAFTSIGLILFTYIR
ncbi:MAG: YIP1 family protein [Anaerolineales bacterium]